MKSEYELVKEQWKFAEDMKRLTERNNHLMNLQEVDQIIYLTTIFLIFIVVLLQW